jgi:hypothetical protein
MVLATLVASGACSSSESPVADSGHRGLAFDTVSEAAAGGDFAVVFEVLSERDFGYSDIQRPADGSPPSSPPSVPDQDYIGRVVHVAVETVVWSDGEHVAPAEFEFVTSGWQLRDGARRVPADSSWYRVEVGERYFGVFSDFGGEIGPMSMDAIYQLDGDQLIEVSAVGGPDEFEGATLPEVSELLGLPRDELLNVDAP